MFAMLKIRIPNISEMFNVNVAKANSKCIPIYLLTMCERLV